MDKDRVRVTHLFDQREGTRYYYNDEDQKNLKEKNRFWFEDGYVHDGPKNKGGKSAQITIGYFGMRYLELMRHFITID